MTTALILGAGADNRHHGGELDGATLAVAQVLHAQGIKTILLNDNPFALSLDSDAGIDYPELAPVTLASVQELVAKYQPDLLIPTLGSQGALDLANQVVESGLLTTAGLQLVGLTPTALHQVTNPVRLAQTLHKLHAPVKLIRTVTTFAAARSLVKEIGFPVIIRAVAPRRRGHRQIVHDYGELERAITRATTASRHGQAVLQQSLAGLKEVEVLVMRDGSGTMMELATVENIDPIGIHAGDSLAVTPAQTLLDRELQDIRDVAFAITRRLRIVGLAHLQFAVDQVNQRFYVTKTVPYFDRLAAFVAQATGYPVATVCGHLYAGQRLREIRLPGQTAYAAVTEPSMDRTAVRWPVFASPDRRLSTEKQSVGAVMGVGRSFFEALTKAAAINEDPVRVPTLDQVRRLTAADLDEQLIHPRANRLVTLLEALRRGYSPVELNELTQIDRYYLEQLKRLVRLTTKLPAQKGEPAALRAAKYWGLSDRQLANDWQMSAAQVRQLAADLGIQRTFKEVDPTAGEFSPTIGSYYATFEREDEPVPADERQRALIVGAGPLTLSAGTAADYLTARLARALSQQGYQVVALNDSPSSLLGLTQLTARRYFEPRTLETTLAVAHRERPALILLPAPLSAWRAELTAQLPTCRVLTVPMLAAPVAMAAGEQNYYLIGTTNYRLGSATVTTKLGPGGRSSWRKDYRLALTAVQDPLPRPLPSPGLYQLVGTNWCPLPAADLAGLMKTLGVDLGAAWLTGVLSPGRSARLKPARNWWAHGQVTFPGPAGGQPLTKAGAVGLGATMARDEERQS